MQKLISILLMLCFVLSISKITYADWVKENDRYRYFNTSTNQYVVNNWVQTGNGYYYLDSAGYTVSGWYYINGKYYYFNNDGLMQTGLIEENGKRYFLDIDKGNMVTGWVQTYVNGVYDYYYFNDDGTMAIGWKQIGGDWYYLYDGKALIDTFAKINDVWYHFAKTGVMDTGWVNVKGKMYYHNLSNGSLVKGWIQDQNGYEYYLSEADGALVTNCTIAIQGRNYTFDDTGRCIAKDQYATSDANSVYGKNVTDFGGQIVYGVNVGVSPSSNQYYGGQTSLQAQQKAEEPLKSGTTTGPK